MTAAALTLAAVLYRAAHTRHNRHNRPPRPAPAALTPTISHVRRIPR